MTFVVSVGYSHDVAVGVVNALKESGLSGGALLSTVRTLAGAYEIDAGGEGLEALAASVEADLMRKKGHKPVTFRCVPPGLWGDEPPADEASREAVLERAFTVEALEGMSITDVAKHGEGPGAELLAEYLECSCAGIMACSTCHVVIDDQYMGRLGEVDEDEQDMIDLAYAPSDSSRLGCQVILSPDVEGLVVYLPRGFNNIMDNIPFEDGASLGRGA